MKKQRFVLKKRNKYVIYDLRKKKVVDSGDTKKVAEDKLAYYRSKYKEMV